MQLSGDRYPAPHILHQETRTHQGPTNVVAVHLKTDDTLMTEPLFAAEIARRISASPLIRH
jgi:hypothetical protein